LSILLSIFYFVGRVMKQLKKDVTASEVGQVIILYAVFILFLVVVGIGLIDIGKVVMFKAKLRNTVDQGVLAAQAVERNAQPILFHVNSNQASRYARMIYHTGIMLQNHKLAADKLTSYVSNYSDLADWFSAYSEEPIENYISLADDLLDIPPTVEYQDSAFLNIEVSGFSTSLDEELLCFVELEKMILYNQILDLNVENSTQEWQNIDSIYIPVSCLLKQSPIESSDVPTMQYYTDQVGGNTTSLFSMQKGIEQVYIRNSFFVMQTVNVPDLLVGDVIFQRFDKMGKVAMMSIGSLQLPSDMSYPEMWLESYETLMHEANIQGQNIIQEMDDYENPTPGHAYGLRKQYMKDKWDELELLYQNLFIELRSIDSLEMNVPSQFYDEALPGLFPLNQLHIENNSDIITMATSMGYDVGNESEKNEFFQEVSLEDFFSTEDNFYQSITTSIDTLEDGIANVFDHYEEYITHVQSYAADTAGSTGNFYSILHSMIESIELHTSFDVQNNDMILYMQMFSEMLLDQYTDAANYRILITHRQGYDYSDLKPLPRTENFINRYFDKPIMEWVQN
jgi:hypothetical protein